MQRGKVQKLIPNGVQVIEYVLLQDRLLIWLVSGKTFASRSIPISRAALDKKVNDFLAGIRKEEDVTGRSRELHRLLIAPVEDLLDPKRTLAIIPDLALHRLAFAALQDSATGDYLIARYAIMESPNLTHLLAGPRETPRRDSFVAFGAQTDDASYTREFAALGRIYPNLKSFAGDDADKAAFLAAMRNVSVFHYAGHSRDAADPLQSSILLDGNRDGPNSVTGLDVSQARMQRNALVVLASCDSSVGNSRDGVGMRGLTSAFLISGAGSVVGSLWPVEAAGTSDLIIHFHETFAMRRTPVTQSLRQAQLAFIKSFPKKSHPYYWSGFVVTGNASALR